MDQLHKQEFTSLLIDVPSNVVRTCIHSCVGLATRALFLIYFSTLHSIYLPPIFLQHSIFISIYHILQLCIFHNASVVIPSIIWVSICYIARVGMSIMQPLICYRIRKWSPCIERNFSPHTKTNEYCHHQRQFSNLGGRCHCRPDSSIFGVACFDNDNTIVYIYKYT